MARCYPGTLITKYLPHVGARDVAALTRRSVMRYGSSTFFIDFYAVETLGSLVSLLSMTLLMRTS